MMITAVHACPGTCTACRSVPLERTSLAISTNLVGVASRVQVGHPPPRVVSVTGITVLDAVGELVGARCRRLRCGSRGHRRRRRRGARSRGRRRSRRCGHRVVGALIRRSGGRSDRRGAVVVLVPSGGGEGQAQEHCSNSVRWHGYHDSRVGARPVLAGRAAGRSPRPGPELYPPSNLASWPGRRADLSIMRAWLHRRFSSAKRAGSSYSKPASGRTSTTENSLRASFCRTSSRFCLRPHRVQRGVAADVRFTSW